MFSHPVWREKPAATAYRYATCMLRKSVPGLSRAVIAYDDHRSRMLVDVRTAFGYTLYRYGHRDADIDLVRLLLSPGDTVVDGGAHVGLFTLVAAARVGPTGRVVAFEPAGETRGYLAKNVELSRFSWVDVRAEALSDASGEREFVSFPVEAWGSSSFAPPEELSGRRVDRVRTVALDDVIGPEERARLRLVKLDLEGAEYAALQGCRGILETVRPDFLVEIEPEHLERQGATVGDILRVFEPLGYAFFRSRWDERERVVLERVSDPERGGERPNLYITTDVGRAARAGVAIL